MTVGILTVDLHIPESGSLKGKRKIIKSLLDRLKSRFNISCAEVSSQDLWQRATLGIVCVNSSRDFANRTLNQVVDMVEQEGEAQLLNYDIELI